MASTSTPAHLSFGGLGRINARRFPVLRAVLSPQSSGRAGSKPRWRGRLADRKSGAKARRAAATERSARKFGTDHYRTPDHLLVGRSFLGPPGWRLACACTVRCCIFSFPDPPPAIRIHESRSGALFLVLRKRTPRHSSVSTQHSLPSRSNRESIIVIGGGRAAPGHTGDIKRGTVHSEMSESYKSTLVKKDSAPQLFWLR